MPLSLPRTAWKTTASLPLATFAATLALSLASDDADACGGFFAKSADVPALEVEETLLVFDPVKGEEHFIREVTFKKGAATFGFVVPTPARPEVAKIANAPFQRLRDDFPMSGPQVLGGRGGLSDIGIGSGGTGKGGVEVLSRQRLGSFTAFVLAATDAGAMTKWLADNHFETTPASRDWLAHYVALHFYFVAFRFEPPTTKEKADSAGDAATPARSTSAETMRISFPTPVPYYPYLEPAHAPTDGPRVLSVWLVTPHEMTPVAAVDEGGHHQWKRPWLEGFGKRVSVASLKETVGPSLGALLPAGTKASADDGNEPSLSVQTFEDQKTSRGGWGDVVLVPNAPVALDAAALAARRPFFALLEPEAGR